ncbi:MAG: bifunctional phosphoribosyl-AMP cyclohydrolase/phosphoribosyl-ATP diphosphatase HisIE [bacterium]|nr:bifunctional phosphoribosyl-AMP cyclohydrolase/phosphoribosyl-ATP diphosphatase HisIE [bacterium]
MTVFDPSAVSFDEEGLVPAIVQDDRTGTVLMLGYMNEESLRHTLRDSLVTFWSRSRRELWQKGSTSGNLLRLVDISIDCDDDALLVRATPSGPTCHTGAPSCFDTSGDSVGFDRLERLWKVIADRAATRPEGSYTAQLVAGGVNAAGRKLTEEATEVLLAAKDHAAGSDQGELAEEAADLLYHLLVLLAEREESPRGVLDALDRRS